MKKVVLAVLMVFTGVTGAFAYTFNDPSSSAQTLYSGDRIGDITFELYGLDFSQDNGILNFDIFTNYPESGYGVAGWDTIPADFALDIDQNGIYEFGIAFTDHDGLTSGGIYSDMNWNISGYDRPNNNFIWHKNEIVTIMDGTGSLSGNVNSGVDWISIGSDPDYKISFSLCSADILPSGFSGDIDFFYGGSTCANDYIEGTVHVDNPVPEPATVILLGSGLLGLAGLRKKKKI